FQCLWRLSSVWVLCAAVDLQLRQLGIRKLVLRQHALDSLLYSQNWVLFQQVCVVDALQATWETGVAVSALVQQLLTGQCNLVSVDDDDMVAHVHVGCKGWLVLAAQQGCGLDGETAEYYVGGVNDIPLTSLVSRLWGVRTHSNCLTLIRFWSNSR